MPKRIKPATVLLAEAARADLEEILAYVARGDSRAALALLENISQQLDRLADQPLMGRSGRVAGSRELVLAGTPYIAAYRVQGQTVQVLRVLHGARQWPRRLF